MAKKQKITLKILFDTNVIFTGSASDLLRKEIFEIIKSHNSVSDINVEWYLPKIVLDERLFQMKKKGNELLPSIQKLERILGHNLNITEEIIETRILATIKKQIDDLNLKIFELELNKIDWKKIINGSVNRLPPFEDNATEKGFRDALIIETLNQIVTESPSSLSICRIIFITNDIACKTAAIAITDAKNNVYIFEKIEELISLINILSSELTESLISNIKKDAQSLFFIKEDKTTLFYTEDIRKKIAEDYADKLSEILEGADKRENGTWWINPPGFEKKEKQKIFWKTVIEIDFTNFKTRYETTPETLSMQAHGALFTFPKKEKLNEGRTRFEVIWSVTLTTTKKLKNQKIESINFLDIILK
jgi:hypothetical protein